MAKNIEEHLAALEAVKVAIGGAIRTPARKAPCLETDIEAGMCRVRWSEDRRRYLITVEGCKERSFPSPETVLRWFRNEL